MGSPGDQEGSQILCQSLSERVRDDQGDHKKTMGAQGDQTSCHQVAIIESFLRGRELMRRCPAVHEVVAALEKKRPFALSNQYSGTILDPRQYLASLHALHDFLAIVTC